MVALTKTKDELKYGWQQWKDSQESRGPVSPEAFELAVAATPREFYQTAVDDLIESTGELSELAKILSEKMGEAAPSLSQVRKALLECQELAQHFLHKKGPAPLPRPLLRMAKRPQTPRRRCRLIQWRGVP